MAFCLRFFVVVVGKWGIHLLRNREKGDRWPVCWGIVLWIREITKSMFILDVNFPSFFISKEKKKDPSCSMHILHCPTQTHTLRFPLFRGTNSKMCVLLCILQSGKHEDTLLRQCSNLAELIKITLCWDVSFQFGRSAGCCLVTKKIKASI